MLVENHRQKRSSCTETYKPIAETPRFYPPSITNKEGGNNKNSK